MGAEKWEADKFLDVERHPWRVAAQQYRELISGQIFPPILDSNKVGEKTAVDEWLANRKFRH